MPLIGLEPETSGDIIRNSSFFQFFCKVTEVRQPSSFWLNVTFSPLCAKKGYPLQLRTCLTCCCFSSLTYFASPTIRFLGSFFEPPQKSGRFPALVEAFCVSILQPLKTREERVRVCVDMSRVESRESRDREHRQLKEREEKREKTLT